MSGSLVGKGLESSSTYAKVRMAAYHRLRNAWYELTANFPEPVRGSLRKATTTPLGYLASLTFRRRELVPPIRFRVRAGLGNWTKVGKEFADIFVKFGGLQPADRVLDIGCGFGRVATALVNYLNPRGSYEGFDVFPEAVEWCRARVTPLHPNFRFRLVDVHNGVYNPNGSVDPAHFAFPYSDGSFDFVHLTSVFTHMLPPGVENYLREISRVLRTGGKCAISCYLINEESVNLMNSGKSEPSFPSDHVRYRLQDRLHPERAVAYDVAFLRDRYVRNGFKIIEPILWGYWCGRDHFLSLQDIIIAEKG